LLSEHQLKSAFGLTASEILLTLRLFAGDTLREAAQTLGISYETARTKLKFIFQKTRTRRQTELVLLLARGGARTGPLASGSAAGKPQRSRGRERAKSPSLQR